MELHCVQAKKHLDHAQDLDHVQDQDQLLDQDLDQRLLLEKEEKPEVIKVKGEVQELESLVLEENSEEDLPKSQGKEEKPEATKVKGGVLTEKELESPVLVKDSEENK